MQIPRGRIPKTSRPLNAHSTDRGLNGICECYAYWDYWYGIIVQNMIREFDKVRSPEI